MSSKKKAAIFFTAFALMLTSAFASFAETINYTYDDMLRLTKAQHGDGTTVDYVYDNLGNRLVKTTTLPGAPANNPPNAATSPTPESSSTGVSTTPTLTWTGGGDPDAGETITYSIYFGTSPSNMALVGCGLQTIFAPGQLQSMTTYYWKVVAKDSHNTATIGPIWTFTTTNSPPVASFIASQATVWVPTTVSFTDKSQDPDGDTIATWAWDFNGDGIIDSTDRNPTFTYTSVGAYTVTLTVTDVHGAAATKTIPAYINVYDADRPSPASVVHCVKTASELNSALNDAQSNGKDNLIHLVQGTYRVSENNNESFRYRPRSAARFYLMGGYTAGCLSRELNPANTTLDGGNILQQYAGILDFEQESSQLDYMEVNGITLQNGNSTATGGLSLYTWLGSATIANSVFKNNVAGYVGGVAIEAGYGSIIVENNVIAHNTVNSMYADAGGLVVYNDAMAKFNMINNTITENNSHGSTEAGGIAILWASPPSVVNVYNNIIWNNPGASGKDIYIDESNGSTATNAYNNDFDPSKVHGTFANAANNINADPLFVNSAAGDYHVQVGSPVIDTGTSTAQFLPETDIAGKARINGTAVDMGAYETTLDTTSPTGSVVINNGANLTNSTSVTLNLYATDPSGVSQMCISDAETCTAWEAYATTKTWNLPAGDGAKTVNVWFKDGMGNVDQTPYPATIALDTTPPQVTITSPVAATTNNRTPLLTYTVSDGTVAVTVDGALVAKVSGQALDQLGDGVHTVRVTATDQAGNPGFASVTFTVDTIPPPVTINPVTTPANVSSQALSGTVEAGAVVTIAVNTAASIGNITYPTSTTWTCIVTGLAPGDNTFTVTAHDAAGNASSSTAIINYRLGLAAVLSPTSVAANFVGSVALVINYLPTPGSNVFIEQFVDTNHNGVIDATDYVVRSFKVTDGNASANPNVQGDEDGAANASVLTTLKYSFLNDLFHASGHYVFRVTQGTNIALAPFVVNSVTELQGISGAVTANGNSVPGAIVQLTDKWQRPVSYALADDAGHYAIYVKDPGNYLVSPYAYGYVNEELSIPVTVAEGQIVTGHDLALMPGVFHVTGLVKDDSTGTGIDGIWVKASGTNGSGVTLSGQNGNYDLLLPAGQYAITAVSDPTVPSPSTKGYLGFDNLPTNVNVTANTSGTDFALPQAGILVTGKVSTALGSTPQGIPVQSTIHASVDPRVPGGYGVTNATGDYTLAVNAGNNWNISLNDPSAQILGYIGDMVGNLSTTSSLLTDNNLTVYPITAWIKGTVKDSNNNLLSGVEVRLRNADSSIITTVKTAFDGTYMIGTFAGNWFVDALSENKGLPGVPERTATLSDVQTTVVDFIVDATSPAITTTMLLDGYVNSSYSQTLAATGGLMPYSWSVTGGTLPTGLILDASTGAITGTPTTTGTNNFTVQVLDANNITATKSLSIVVSAQLNISTASLPEGYVGSTYSHTLAATGGATPYVWSVTTGSLPVGLTLNASTGAITGTPTIAGTSSFTIQALDSNNITATKSLSIAISEQLSVFISSLPGDDVNNAYSQTLVATGGKTPYVWSVTTGGLPVGLTLNATSGALTGTPTIAGTSTFTVQVMDANNITATKSLSIVISAQLSASTVSLPSSNVGSAYSQTLAATGGATPYTWSVITGSLPAGLTLNASTGAITGTPTTAGTTSFTVQVLDANNVTATKNLSILISSNSPIAGVSPSSLAFGNQPVNTASQAQSVTLSNTGNAALTINSIVLSGTNAGDFAKSSTCGANLAAGANCTINVSFTPTGAVVCAASLTISSNDSVHPSLVVALSGTGTAVPLAIDATVTTDVNTATSLTTPSFSTTSPNELLLAFIAAGDPSSTAPAASVTGITDSGGLTWVLVQRTNVQRGTAEIWRAFAASPLTNRTVTATLNQSVQSGSITVVSFTGADTSGTNGSGAIGATASANGPTGAPSVSLATTRPNSWVFGVGNDWDGGIARTLGSNQTMIHEYLAPSSDTFWVQRQTTTTLLAGTTVTINDTAPTYHRYNLTAVEIRGPLPTGTSVANVSPASLAFGNQPVNTTSQTQSVILSNTGNATLTINSIGLTGTNAGDFAQSNACGANLAAGANCTISVSFTPAAIGTRAASLAISTNDPVNPSLTVPISGGLAIDVTASADFSSTTLIDTPSFSTTSPNELLLAFVSAGNPGSTAPATSVDSIMDSSGLSWVLVKRTNTQRGTAEIWRAFAVSPLTNCTVTAMLNQRVPSSSITVVAFTGADTSGTNGSGAIGATGSANGPTGAPSVSLATTRHNSWVFGVGNDYNGQIARTLGTNQTMVHQYPSDTTDTYWVQRQTTTTPLAGTTVTINDTTPITDPYNLSAVEIMIPLPAGTPVAIVSPASLAFGNQTVNTISQTQSVTLSNTGNAALTINSIGLTGTNAGDFAKSSTCGVNLTAGGSCTISVSFTPAVVGTRTASLAISNSDPVNPSLTVTLGGTGSTGTPSAPVISLQDAYNTSIVLKLNVASVDAEDGALTTYELYVNGVKNGADRTGWHQRPESWYADQYASVDNLTPGTQYSITVKGKDSQGNLSYVSNTVIASTL